MTIFGVHVGIGVDQDPDYFLRGGMRREVEGRRALSCRGREQLLHCVKRNELLHRSQIAARARKVQCC